MTAEQFDPGPLDSALKIGASLLPGAGGAECYFDGCGVVGWGIAAIDALPGGKGISVMFQTGHYSSRLLADGLDVSNLEAIARVQLSNIPISHLTVGARIYNRLIINNVPVIYRAELLSSGKFNVGTIHVDDLRWKK